MRTSVGDAVRAIPHAVIVQDMVVAAVRDGASLEQRLISWMQGHRDGCQVLPPDQEAPLIDKSVLRARPIDFIGTAGNEEGVAVKYTSGTTGRPVPIIFDRLSALEQAVVASRRIAALQKQSDVPVAKPGGFVTVAVTEAAGLVEEIWIDPWGGFVVQLLVDEADPARFERLVGLARQLQPDVLTLKPTLLAALLEHCTGSDLLAGIAGLVAVSGSDFGPEARAQAEQRLGVPVAEAYGLTEFGLVAAECDARTGLHVDPDFLPEILNHSTGRLAGASETPATGELVLTGLRNAAYPLTRYRTGDLATLVGSVCACGRRTARLTALSGRLVRNFRLPDGRLLSPSHFNRLFARHPLAEFQLVQLADGSFRLRAEPKPGERLETSALAADMRAMIGPTVFATVEIGAIPRSGKFQRYVCEAQ